MTNAFLICFLSFSGLCRGGLTPVAKTTSGGGSKLSSTTAPAGEGSSHASNSKVMHGKSSDRKVKKVVELSEARKSLRRQRNILSGRAESLGKLNSAAAAGAKLSVYNASGGGGESTSTGTEDTSAPPAFVPNIYATLRKQKKKCKSLNGDLTPTALTSSTKEGSSFDAQTSRIGSDSLNDLLNDSGSVDSAAQPKNNTILHTHQLYLWLKEIKMEQYKDLLISNGYDNLNFMVSSSQQ